MKKILLCLLLTACATTPAEKLMDSVHSDLKSISSDISKLPDVCRPDEFTARINAVEEKATLAEESYAVQLNELELKTMKQTSLIIVLCMLIFGYIVWKFTKS